MEPRVLEIAQGIKTPLALAALALLVVYLLFRDFARQNNKPIVGRLSTFAFVLALVAMLGAIGGWVFPSVSSSASVTLYGKVHKGGDRSIGISGAEVSLEVDSTIRTSTNDSGDFAFQLPMSSMGRQAWYYAKAEGYVPALATRLVLAEAMDKLVIALAAQVPAPVPTPDHRSSPQHTIGANPLVPAAAGAKSAAVMAPTGTGGAAADSSDAGTEVTPSAVGANASPRRSLWFNYPFPPEGERVWTQTANKWVETYPDGSSADFVTKGQATVESCDGQVVERADRLLEVFIPNPGCSLHWLRFRQRDGEWAFLGEANERSLTPR